MQAVAPIHRYTERKLLANTRLQSGKDAQAFALAAIRETFEETGLVIGARHTTADSVSPGPWFKFVQTGFYPDPSLLHFIARQSRRQDFQGVLTHASFASIAVRSHISWKMSFTPTLNLSSWHGCQSRPQNDSIFPS